MQAQNPKDLFAWGFEGFGEGKGRGKEKLESGFVEGTHKYGWFV